MSVCWCTCVKMTLMCTNLSKMTGLGLVTYCALESAVDFTIYLLLLFSYPIIPKLILYHGAQ